MSAKQTPFSKQTAEGEAKENRRPYYTVFPSATRRSPATDARRISSPAWTLYVTEVLAINVKNHPKSSLARRSHYI